MKNKKGETLLVEEAFKIILAGLCIVLLLILAVKIYGLIIEKTKIEQAKATLNIITEKIEQVKKDNISITFIINSPKDYYIYFTGGDRCKGKYCLCFAPPKFGTHDPDYSSEICKATNYFIEVNNLNKVIEGEFVVILQSTSIKITKKDENYFILDCNSASTSSFVRWWREVIAKIKD